MVLPVISLPKLIPFNLRTPNSSLVKSVISYLALKGREIQAMGVAHCN